jgi:poly-beta-1,6-N-acetyl-D-glucosamine N-deacetylase
MTLKQSVYKGLRLSGIPFLLRNSIQLHRVPIITFHNPSYSTFETAIRFFIRHYNIISLKDYVFAVENKIRIPNRAIIITFDDGHIKNFDLLEIITRFQVPVTIFICSELMGTNKHFWWTQVKNKISSEDWKIRSIKEKDEFLKKYDIDPAREYSNDTRQTMNLEEIGIMKKTGLVDFQSHTSSHPMLPYCTDEESLSEIKNSKNQLESVFQHPIYAIAFPFGQYSQREINFARQSHYVCTLTTKAGNNPKEFCNTELKRLGIRDHAEINEIIVKSSGLWSFLRFYYYLFRNQLISDNY